MLKGSIVALVTPFQENGDIDFNRLKELIEFHIENKTDGILVLGTTGESPTLTHEEDEAVVKFTIKQVNKRIPVIVGAGSNCTRTSLIYSKKYAELGADALLVISPYYNKANYEGMKQHFLTVADNVDIPLILYNIPGRTGCSISVELLKELSQHKNIIGIKEASGDISYASKVATLLNDNFVMYSGNDDIVVAMLALGASGVISAAANIIPNEMHNICEAFFNNDVETARRIQLKYLNLINALFIEVNPIPIKAAMALNNMSVGGYRLPLCEISENAKEVLIKAMEVLK